MLPLSSLSRRALVAAAAVAALAPHAEASKRKKPPLAFVAVRVTDINPQGVVGFRWDFTGIAIHPGNGTNVLVTGTVVVDAGASNTETRSEITAAAKSAATAALLSQGAVAPEDRIAVTLL
jgi:hypothetical protein